VQILSRQLISWGIQATSAGSSEEVITLFKEPNAFDLAILDFDIQGINTLSLARRIHDLCSPARLPLILLNNLGELILPENLSDFAAVLTKPVKASQLFDTLLCILTGNPLPECQPKEKIGFRLDSEMSARMPLSILLTEDNLTNQKLAVLLLENLGYHTDIAQNGLEALAALKKQHYDIILMDIQMPEMDGLEATQRIRQDFPADHQPRIIAMTANALKEDRERCLNSGMDDYISKPIQVEVLVQALSISYFLIQKKPVTAYPQSPRTNPPNTAQLEPDELVVETPPAAETTVDAPSQPPIFDPKAIEQLKSNLGKQAAGLLPTLLDDFQRDTNTLLQDARRALQLVQPIELRRAAHTLKSNSATFGLLAMSSIARELEFRARDGILESASSLIDQIESEYGKGKQALEQYWNQISQ
jgi:CheY-like chemotaxis protein/HPt (histidine-containing phosphotransfer) domain-containing protein